MCSIPLANVTDKSGFAKTGATMGAGKDGKAAEEVAGDAAGESAAAAILVAVTRLPPTLAAATLVCATLDPVASEAFVSFAEGAASEVCARAKDVAGLTVSCRPGLSLVPLSVTTIAFRLVAI